MIAGLLLPLVLLQAPQEPEKESVRARALLWWPDLSGSLSVDQTHLSGFPFLTPITEVVDAQGTGVSFGEDAGIEGGEMVPALELGFRLGHGPRQARFPSEWWMDLSWWGHAWSGDQILDGPERIEHTAYPAGRAVRGDLDFDAYEMKFSWEGRPDPVWGVSASIGVRYTRLAFNLESGLLEEPERFHALLVGLGVGAEWRPVPAAALGLRFGGYAGYGGPQGEAEAYSAGLAGPVRFEAGWRRFGYDEDGDHERVRLSLSGPYVALGLRF